MKRKPDLTGFIIILFLSLFFVLPLSSQTNKGKITITGTVVDDKGEPIIGANIVEKGTTNGMVTDIDGKFSIEAPSSGTLQVTYIGYTPQDVPVQNKTVLSVTLKENTQKLNEVVVIGYGTVKRKDFTGSVSSVKLENSPIAMQPNLNALESLKGNVSGLNMGASTKAGEDPGDLMVRGQNSISGDNKPLIVLDGVIFMGNIGDINPNDIASVDVLKDATSAAAYGSRSANGVIAITTKKGTSDKPVISFNANIAAQTWQNKPELMKGDEWFASVNARNGYEAGSTNWLRPGELRNMENGNETDWLDVASRTGFLQDYQVSVSGASPKVNYYLSGSYSGNKGIVVGNDYNRISLMGKMKTDITSWLEVGIDGAYTKADYSGFEANLSEAYSTPPYGVLYRDEANKLLEKYPTEQSIINPLWGVDDGTRENKDIRRIFRLNSHALVKIPWIQGLTYRVNYMGNWEHRNISNFTNETFFVQEGAYDDESRYSQAAYETLLAKAKGDLNTPDISGYVIDHIVHYANTFGKHNVDVTLVATRDRNEEKGLVTTGIDYSENGNTTLGIYGLNKATYQTVAQQNKRWANVGYLARASYSYNDKYYATGSFRRDGASVFGRNNKWGNFGAFGLAWRISGESFMKGIKQLDNLKLKLSWGQNGNQGIEPYGTLSTVANGSSGGLRYQFSDTGSKNHYGLIQDVLGNSDLGWESTASYNAGFESSWFGGRLTADFDFYKSKTTDQLFTQTIPVMTGFKNIKASMGQVNNLGVELTLHSINIQTKDWTWGTGFTFWKNKNKLVKLYGQDLDGDGKEDDDLANSLFIGKPLGAIYGYKQIGIVQEDDAEYIKLTGSKPGSPKYADIDGTPGISATDREILGYKKENFRMNLSNTVSYKDFQLYVMISGTFGGNNYFMKSNTGAYMTMSGRFNTNGIGIDHWTPENRSNEYPAITFAGDGGRFLGLQNRAFVRLQDVTLSYTFHQPWMEKSFISSLKVFASAKNLLTFTKWDGGDPEAGATVRENIFPVPTTFSFGTTFTF